MISADHIKRFDECKRRFELLKPEVTMRPVLSAEETTFLDKLMAEVQMSVILDHMGAATFECADSCDGEGRDSLAQQAACIVAAALFCRTWGQP